MTLISADIEALTISYLADKTTAPISTIVQPFDDTFIRIVAAGGVGRHNHVFDKTNIVVETWATNSVQAITLTRLIEAHLIRWPYVDSQVVKVEAYSAPANLPDPVTGSPRYITNYAITTRIKPITNTGETHGNDQ